MFCFDPNNARVHHINSIDLFVCAQLPSKFIINTFLWAPPKIINFYLSQTIAKRMREGGWMNVQWFFLDMRAATIRKLYGRLYSSSGVYA